MDDYYKQKGRADAAAGRYDPPEVGIIREWLGSSHENEKIRLDAEKYREGHEDKERELKSQQGRR